MGIPALQLWTLLWFWLPFVALAIVLWLTRRLWLERLLDLIYGQDNEEDGGW